MNDFLKCDVQPSWGRVMVWLSMRPSGVPVKANIRQQFDIFRNQDTWWMTILYIMTFGTFSGLAAQFGLLMTNLYGSGNTEIVEGSGATATHTYAADGPYTVTLTVTDVRVQRLQDISEEDAIAEGVPHVLPDSRIISSFATLWDSLNADRAPWSANPWVWVVEFSMSGNWFGRIIVRTRKIVYTLVD